MAIFSISYDLRQDRDYETLYAAIRSYGNYCRPLESLWFIKAVGPASAICEFLWSSMDASDGLVVAEASGEIAWQGITEEHAGWLRSA